MLSRSKNGLNSSVSDWFFFPPHELSNPILIGLTHGCKNEISNAARHKPIETGKSFIKFLNRVHIEMVVVIVRNHHCVNMR